MVRIGEAARNLLKSGLQGRILAVFSKAIYLNSINGELFWLVSDDIPMHRRGIQIHGTLPRITADLPFSVSGQHLILKPDTRLDLSPESFWIAPRPNSEKSLPFERLADRLWDILDLLADFPTPTGFGCFLYELARAGPGNPYPGTIPDCGMALNHARPTLNKIVDACIASDFPRILANIEDLIGLGEGLTPSGDDFIGGLLFSSLTIQEMGSPYQGFPPEKVALFIENSRNRTNLISFTMLEEHAAGHASETLHRFVNAILTDKDMLGVNHYGLELIRLGSSTGWDLLTGVWMGMLLSLGSRVALSNNIYDSTSSRY